MAQIYKVLEAFELDGVAVKAGEEIACRAREAEVLIKEKKLAVSDRELDLNDPKDMALKAAADKRAEKKNKDLNDADSARETAKNDREAERDAVRKEKLGTISTLLIQKKGDPEVPADVVGMQEEELDKVIADLESMPDMPVETAKYKITGEAAYTDQDGNHAGYLEVGSIQELPVVVGERFIVDGVAEAYVEQEAKPAPKRTRTAQ